MKFYADFPIYSDNIKKDKEGVLILTEQSLLFCENKDDLSYSTKLNDIKDVSVYEGGEDNQTKQKLYHLYIYTKNDDNYAFETVQYSLVYKTYTILNKASFFRSKQNTLNKIN